MNFDIESSKKTKPNQTKKKGEEEKMNGLIKKKKIKETRTFFSSS